MLTNFGNIFLLFYGSLLIIINIIDSNNANKERKNKFYPSTYVYICDIFFGIIIILIVFGVI